MAALRPALRARSLADFPLVAAVERLVGERQVIAGGAGRVAHHRSPVRRDVDRVPREGRAAHEHRPEDVAYAEPRSRWRTLAAADADGVVREARVEDRCVL